MVIRARIIPAGQARLRRNPSLNRMSLRFLVDTTQLNRPHQLFPDQPMNQLIDDLERSVAELKLGYFVRIVKRADRLEVIQSENRLVGSAGNRQAIPNELRIFAMPNALDEIGLVARAPAISVHTIIRCNQYRWCGGILRRSLGQRLFNRWIIGTNDQTGPLLGPIGCPNLPV